MLDIPSDRRAEGGGEVGMTETDLHWAAINHYGNVPNMIKAVEEMAELTQMLCKRVTGDACDMDHLREEIADMGIMIERLTLIFGPARVAEVREQKLKRLAGRLGLDEKEAAAP